MVVFEQRFSNHSLPAKITKKFLIYLSFLMTTIVITFLIAGAIESGVHPFHPDVIQKLGRFLISLTFINTALQLSFSLTLSLIYAAISENLGHQIFINFFTGRYHSPKVERRIFMFLDMKESTTIAEKLGHVAYFNFLQQYYQVMSHAIIQHLGEVYQYVGDEVVITWKAEDGLKDSNCLKCFFRLKAHLNKTHQQFIDEFGIRPDFKAGIHIGEVTTGEIGALKKEIVFSGDVLNTTARLQSLCKKYKQDLLVSEDLVIELNGNNLYEFTPVDEIQLTGKSVLTKVFGVKSLQ